MINLLVFLLVFFLLLSGFCAASETAFFSLPSTKVAQYRDSKEKKKMAVAKLLDSPRELMSTILIINVVVNLMVQNVASNILGDYSGWLLNVGIPLFLTLIFGDLIPKSLGMAYNDRVTRFVVPFFTRLKAILSPIQLVLTNLAATLTRIFFFYLKEESAVSVEELQHALDDIRQSGEVQDDEAELVSGYLRFQKARVIDLMRVRDEVLFYDIEDDISKVAYLIKDQECSRVPICEGGIDKVRGVMTSRLFAQNPDCIKDKQSLLESCEKPFFVPENTLAKSLLKQFHKRKESFAIVIDEQDGVSGIITLEDLVEEVIGEITDKREDKQLYSLYEGGVLICNGKMELAAIEELLQIKFKTEYRPVTIGGYLTELHGDIPKTGLKLENEVLDFYTLSSDETRVRRVYMRKKVMRKMRGEK